MKSFTFLVLFLLVIFLLPHQSEGCSYLQSESKTVEEGDQAYYFVRVTNDDQPLGIDISFDIEQSDSTFDVNNDEFHLNPGDWDFVHIYVNTECPEIDALFTNFTAYEKAPTDPEPRIELSGGFKTTINHPPPPPSPDPFIDRPNVFLGVLTVSIIGIILVWAIKLRYSYLLPGYSLLKKEGILQNKYRKEIYTVVCEHGKGITQNEIQRSLNYDHHRLVQYHLERLKEHRLVKRVDDLYYSSSLPHQKPFVDQIREAMNDGLRTPPQIAQRIGAHPQRVRRAMKKHNIG